MKRLALLSLVVPSLASAEPDLRVKQLPVQLKMPARPKVPARVSTKRTAQTAGPETGTNAPTIDPYAESSLTSFTPLPKSQREWAERINLKVRAGIELDGAGASGEPLRGGAALPDGFAESRPWVVGDAMVGARDMLLPSLGAYFLTSFQLDASDSLATRSAFVRPYDNEDAYNLAIKAGYAEWGRDDRRPDQKLWLRGGRQFRLDGNTLFAYFDGGTVGYRGNGVEASGFAGQRVALYVDTPQGLLFGGTSALDLKKLANLPARVTADYMGLAIDGLGIDDEVVSQTRHLLELRGHYDVSQRTGVDVRARIVDAARDDDADMQADGFALGRIGGRIKTHTKTLIVILDVEHRDGGDLAYDLAAPSAVDVVNVSRQLGVGLATPIAATTIGGQLDWRKKDTELLAFARAELPDDAREVTTVDQRGWFEGGLAVAGAPLGTRAGGVYATAQYKLRQYKDYESCDVRETGACMLGADRNDQAFGAFGDSATSGLDRLHEIAADATMRSTGTGPRRWRFALGAFYRIYDFGSPYVDVTDEGRGGGRADLHYWFARDVRAEVAAEVAEASPVLARELGTMTSVRATLEARW